MSDVAAAAMTLVVDAWWRMETIAKYAGSAILVVVVVAKQPKIVALQVVYESRVWLAWHMKKVENAWPLERCSHLMADLVAESVK